MSESAKTKWRIAGEEVGNCNCSWGCPCQFNALPTTGRCEALLAWQISNGYFGDTRLDGVRFARAYWWPGAIHEGNGVRRTIIDEQATKEQRDALIAAGVDPLTISRRLGHGTSALYLTHLWTPVRGHGCGRGDGDQLGPGKRDLNCWVQNGSNSRYVSRMAPC